MPLLGYDVDPRGSKLVVNEEEAARVRTIFELYMQHQSMNPDEWIALAGRVSEDISQIISEQPTEFPDLLRALRGLTPEQLRKLRGDAERMKEEGE